MRDTPITDAWSLDERDGVTHPDLCETYMAWTDYWALRECSRKLERIAAGYRGVCNPMVMSEQSLRQLCALDQERETARLGRLRSYAKDDSEGEVSHTSGTQSAAAFALPIRAVEVGGKKNGYEFDFGWCAADANDRVIAPYLNQQQATALAAALNGTPSSAAAPEGWRLVPEEITEKMASALNSYAVCSGYVELGYRAMLAVAPKAPQSATALLCPKCGTDRAKAPCPKGHTAAAMGQCPMVGDARGPG